MNKILQYTIFGILISLILILINPVFYLFAFILIPLTLCTGIVVQYLNKVLKSLKKLNRRLDDWESQKAAELSGEALDEADNTEINDIQNKEESDTTNVSPCEEQ